MDDLRATTPPPAGGPKVPAMVEVETWIGWRVDDVHGCMMGHVESIRQDPYRRPQWLIVSEFRLGEGRRFVIPARDAVGCSGRVWSPHPRERIKATAGMAQAHFSPQTDQALGQHYTTNGGTRRAA
jgi:hypothetical protein